MNRERLLLVIVLAIFALWFFVMREKPEVDTDLKPKVMQLDPKPVKGHASPQLLLTQPKVGIWELVTNEKPHPRPPLENPEARDLPNVWPPTSVCVSVDRYGMLRRAAAPAQEGGATIQLPAIGAAAAVAGVEETRERLDEWESFGRANKGRVTGFVVKGEKIFEPQKKLPTPGADALAARFYRLLALIEVDPGRAQAEGITEVRIRFAVGGAVNQGFPDEIGEIKIATEGKQKGWFDGYKAYLRLPAQGAGPRITAGKRLLEQGVNDNDTVLMEWALFVLDEARAQLGPGAGQQIKEILLLQLEAANLLNRQELVLNLAFEHLSRFPGEEEVIVYMGDLLASRSFDVLPMAADMFGEAKASRYAQRRRVEVLVKLGRFDEANAVLEGGRVGSGPEVDLLQARVALALGDLERARSLARNRASGEFAADAHQILGAVAYVSGDAATAESEFMNAVTAAPRRSTAYSDLGLALAAQGKNEDARACFARALELDPIDNPVTPRLGEAWIKLNAGALDDARAMLNKTKENNPRDLLVRYMLAYSQELAGDLDGAAQLYRSTLDDDHRYRIAIARLGLVQSRRVEAGAGGENAKAAVAHLRKAVALNPSDPVLPYVLARFLMTQRMQPQLADDMFQRTEKMPSPPGDPDLRFWAQAARAVLMYRDETQTERTVKARFTQVMEAIKDYLPPGQTEKQRMDHPVYAFARECLDVVQENETKVDKTWDFPSEPRDWKFNRKDPMRVAVNRDRPGVVFSGTIDYGGQKSYAIVLDSCAVEYDDRDLNGNTFYELHVTGSVPENPGVHLGVGLVNKARGRRGPTGVQVRRKPRTGTVEVRLDGGEHEIFKRVKAADYVEMDKVAWPTGKFELHLQIEGGDKLRSKGRFSLHINGTNVFREQLDVPSERCSIFGRGRANRPIVIYIWVEGADGLDIPAIRIEKVVLTRKARKS